MDRPRGHLIHVDSHFSATAASADEWIWVRPGTEGLLAQAIGAVLTGTQPDPTIADRTGVTAARVTAIAERLSQEGPSLVIGGGNAGGHTNGTDALTTILQLNVLLGNVGRSGGVLASPPPPAGLDAVSRTTPIGEWQDLVQRMRSGQEQAVLILGGANPVHGLPAALGFAEALDHVPFVASFASFDDDTTGFADLLLPANLPLEDWSVVVPQASVAASIASVQQPIVQPLFDTRSVWDVLLTLADELGDATRQALPWVTFKDVVRATTTPLQPGSWTELLQHGGWWDPGALAAPLAAPPSASRTLPDAQLDGDPATYPLVLVPFEHNTLGSGTSAHLPWLQAAPDPVTSVTWQTWVEVNPRVAEQLALHEGDVVTVESSHGRIEAPVYVSPAAPPEVLAIPLGQGHAGYGRWATGRGANPFTILAPVADATTGGLAYGATRVRMARTGRGGPLPKFEGSGPVQQLPGQEVLETIHE